MPSRVIVVVKEKVEFKSNEKVIELIHFTSWPLQNLDFLFLPIASVLSNGLILQKILNKPNIVPKVLFLTAPNPV